MLDLVQLRSFLAVEQMASFTLAAERLGLGQSTVSQHIRRLEADLGRKLRSSAGYASGVSDRRDGDAPSRLAG
jgi:DNA-binding transcriptional LysR family regulator